MEFAVLFYFSLSMSSADQSSVISLPRMKRFIFKYDESMSRERVGASSFVTF